MNEIRLTLFLRTIFVEKRFAREFVDPSWASSYDAQTAIETRRIGALQAALI